MVHGTNGLHVVRIVNDTNSLVISSKWNDRCDGVVRYDTLGQTRHSEPLWPCEQCPTTAVSSYRVV